MQHFSLDHLTDIRFEEFCYDLLVELGFTNLSWRKGTGLSSSPADRGRDIECQLVREDIDGDTYLETWFVECKHYKQGVPPDAIHGALSWAASERPDKVLLIVSNFLSNPTKDFLNDYLRNNKPSFKIKFWEKPRLERLSLDKLNLLKKYELFGHLTYTDSLILNTFIICFMDFETAVRNTLQIMGVVLSKKTFQSAGQLWRIFIHQIGEPSKQYVKDVEEVIVVRNKIVHGEPISDAASELLRLTSQLKQTINFVQTYCISHDILPELKEKYAQWLRPDIISVRIIQKHRTVFLETATKTKHRALDDEEVMRINLGFVETDDQPAFPPQRTAEENADDFVNKFDPFSIIMCTDLFTPESGEEINKLYRQDISPDLFT